jgi:DNA-directed RNA polymerase alpha subunit
VKMLIMLEGKGSVILALAAEIMEKVERGDVSADVTLARPHEHLPLSPDMVLALPIEDLDLSVRAYNCLKREGLHTIGALVGRTEKQLRTIRNFKDASVAEVKQRLVRHGLALKPEPQSVPEPPVAEAEPEDGTPLTELDLQVRSFKILKQQGVNTVERLTAKTARDLRAYGGFGDASLKDVRTELARHELALAGENWLKYVPTPVEELPIEDLDLTVRTYNCIKREGIDTIGQLAGCTEAGLATIRHFKDECVAEVKQKLQSVGLTLTSEN